MTEFTIDELRTLFHLETGRQAPDSWDGARIHRELLRIETALDDHQNRAADHAAEFPRPNRSRKTRQETPMSISDTITDQDLSDMHVPTIDEAMTRTEEQREHDRRKADIDHKLHLEAADTVERYEDEVRHTVHAARERNLDALIAGQSPIFGQVLCDIIGYDPADVEVERRRFHPLAKGLQSMANRLMKEAGREREWAEKQTIAYRMAHESAKSASAGSYNGAIFQQRLDRAILLAERVKEAEEKAAQAEQLFQLVSFAYEEVAAEPFTPYQGGAYVDGDGQVEKSRGNQVDQLPDTPEAIEAADRAEKLASLPTL